MMSSLRPLMESFISLEASVGCVYCSKTTVEVLETIKFCKFVQYGPLKFLLMLKTWIWWF